MSEEKSKQQEEENNRCQNYLKTNLSKNIKILHLLKNIEGIGCEIPDDFFSCQHCEEGEISGGFKGALTNEKDYKPQVMIYI